MRLRSRILIAGYTLLLSLFIVLHSGEREQARAQSGVTACSENLQLVAGSPSVLGQLADGQATASIVGGIIQGGAITARMFRDGFCSLWFQAQNLAAAVAANTTDKIVCLQSGTPAACTGGQIAGLAAGLLNNFSVRQTNQPVALVESGNIAPNFALGNLFTLTLTGNRTLANPTGLVTGMSFCIKVTNNGPSGVAGINSFGSVYQAPGGTASLLFTQTNPAVDELCGRSYDGSTIQLTIANAYAHYRRPRGPRPPTRIAVKRRRRRLAA